jgi:hypothetical protein
VTEKGGLRLEAGDGRGHEGEEEDEECEEGGETATWVEGNGVVDRCDAEETEGKQEDGPDKPAVPEEIAKGKQDKGKEKRGKTVKASVDGAEDVPAVELSGGQHIQRRGKEADPSGATYGR